MSNTNVGIVLKLDGAQAVDAGFKQISESANKAGAALGAMSAQAGAGLTGVVPGLRQIDAGLKQVGMSAKATAAAMRGVPAQFTDIVVSLQGGQNPLTVLMQQGGQLKDMFGGIGPAAKALGSYVAGLVNPFTLAAAAAGTLGAAYYMGSKEADAYAKALIMTGNAAGTTVLQMQGMAKAIADSTGATQGAAAEALSAMAASGKVGADDLAKFTETAVKLQREAGIAVEDTVKAFAKLADDPVKASAKLSEETGFLTHAIYEQIAALQKQGDAAGAAALASEEYARVMNGRAEALRQNLGIIEQGWRGIIGAAKSAWDAMLNVGRPGDPAAAAAQALEAAQIRLAYVNRAARPGDAETWQGAQARQEVERLQALAAATAGLTAGKQADAKAAAEQLDNNRKAIESENKLIAMRDEFAPKQQKLNKALADYNKELANIAKVNPNAAALDPKRIAADLLAIKDKYKETGTKGPESAYTDLAAAADLYLKKAEEELDSERKRSEAERYRAESIARLTKAYSDGKLTMEQFGRVLDKINAGADARARADEMLLLQKSQLDTAQRLADAKNKEREASNALANQLVAEQEAKATSARDVAADLEAQVAQYGMLRSQVEQLKLAELERARRLAVDSSVNAQSLDMQIAAQQRIVAAATTLEAKDSAKKAAEEAQAEWKKTSESINNTLTDALMRGFESGKDFAKNLRDTVVNMFKTMVLRPAISAVMSPISAGITNVLGGAVGQSAGSSMLGSAAGNMAGSYFAGGMAGMTNGFIASSAGQSLGLSTLSGGGDMLLAGSPAVATAAGSAVSSLAGALPWIGAGLLALKLLSSMDKSGTPHVGASAGTGSLAGSTNTLFGWSEAQDKKGQQAAQGIATSITSTLASLDKLSGGLGKFSVATGYLDDSSKDGAWGALIIKKLDGVIDKTLVDWNDTRTSKWAPKEFGNGDQGVKDYNLALGKDVKAVIDAMELPAWAQTIMDTVSGSEPSLETLAQAVDEISAMPEKILQGIGTSSQALAGIIIEGMTAGSGVSADLAGQAFADTITYGIQQSIYGNFATQITSIISTGLVTPIVTAMTAGTSITEAMASLSIDSMVEQATAAAQALGKIINNEDFKAALTQINTGIANSLSGIIAEQPKLVAPPASFAAYTAAKNPVQEVQDQAAKDAEDLAKKHADTLLGLQKEYANLEIELLKAQGKEQEALTKQRALDTAEMDAASIAQYDLNAARRAEIKTLADLKAGIEAFNSAASANASKFLSGDALASFQYSDVARGLVGTAGITAADVPALASAFSNASLDQIKALWPDLMAMGSAAFINAAGQLVDLKTPKTVSDTAQTQTQPDTSAADALAASIKALTGEGKQLAAQLLGAQGDADGMKKALRALAIEGFTQAEITLYDANQSLKDQIDLLGKLNTLRDAGAALDVEYLRAIGDEQGAKLAQQAIDTKNMGDFEKGLYYTNELRRDEIDLINKTKSAAQALWQTMDSLAEKFLDADTAVQYRATRLTQKLVDGKLIAPADAAGVAKNLLGLSVAELKTLGQTVAAAFDTTTQTGMSAADTVLQVAGGLIELAQAAQDAARTFGQALDSLAPKYLSGNDLRQYQGARATQGLVDAGLISAGDAAVVTARLLAMTSDQIRTLGVTVASSFDLTTDAGRAAALAVAQTGAAFIDLASASEQARAGLQDRLDQLLGNTAALRERELAALDASLRPLQQRIWALEDADKAVDNALSSVGRAIDVEKTRITDAADDKKKALQDQIDANNLASDASQKLVDSLKNITDGITEAVKTLRGTSDAVNAMNLVQARSYIDMSLSLAQAGVMPDEKKLQDAIKSVTSDEAKKYRTKTDYDRAQLLQANKLEALGALTGGKLTSAEAQLKTSQDTNKLLQDQIKAIDTDSAAQLKALDAQLKAAQDAVSVMRGVDVSVKSVAEAIAGLNAALTGLATARTNAGTPSTLPTTATQISTGSGSSDAQSAYLKSIGLLPDFYGAPASDGKYRFADGVLYTPQGTAQSIGSLTNTEALAQYQSMFGVDNIVNLGSKTEGFTQAYTDYLQAIQEELKGLPKFAVGTNYVPGNMLAQIHEGEAIIPKAYNPAAGGQVSNAELREENSKLRAEMAEIKALLKEIADSSKKSKDTLIRVTRDGNSLVTTTA